MELKVARDTYTTNSTTGRLSVNGEFECYTLEDVVRPTKVYGETAIPTGKYKVVVTFSPHFKMQLPLLVDVPGYSGVRIHTGNNKTHTLGCLLVGQSRGADVIGSSVAAFGKLMPKIQAAVAKEEVFIEFVNEGPGPLPGMRSAPGSAPKGLPPAQLGTPWQPPGARLVVRAAPAAKKAAVKQPTAPKAKPKPAVVPKQAAAKKAAAKKAAVKRAAVKRAAVKRAAVKKAVPKKAVAKKVVAKKAATQKPVKATGDWKAMTKQAATRPTAGRRVAAKKGPTKKSAAKKAR